MTINVTMYDTVALLGVMRQMQPPTSYWRDLSFSNTYFSDDEFIDFEKLGDVRRIAPFVAPMTEGQPIYSSGSIMTRFKPAYIKPKDAVNPTRPLKRLPGTLGEYNGTGAGPNMQQRYTAIVADILRVHSDAIQRRWEWMAAQATITGQVTITDERYPQRVINFGRNSAHSVVLGTGSHWGDTGVNILDDILTWREMIRRAFFGGPTTRITMGPNAWNICRNDTAIQNLLKFGMDKYANGLDPNMGLRDGNLIESVGKLSNSLEVIVYSDYYQSPVDGSQIPYLDPDTIVITGPNVQGFACFGAILDPYANFQPLAMFPRMYLENDPPSTMVLTQSAPLYVPVNPNNTFSAVVTNV
jgi:hypothetical protein